MKSALLLLAATLGLAAQTLKIDVQPKAELKADKDVPFEVTIRNPGGAPVAGAEVRVVATMVDMDHGEFPYNATQLKPGVYRFTSNFMMSGAWNLAITAKKGAAAGQLNRRIDVKE